MGICALLAGAAPTIAQEDTSKAGLKSETKQIKATVQNIDKEAREVTLKKEDGSTVTIKAPETVRNFDKIKVGDIVTAKYAESVAASVRKSDEPPSATGRESVARGTPGEGSGVASQTVQISATVEKINRDTRELTLKGPEGNTKVVKVPEEMKKFDELKEGDQVVITTTVSVALSLSNPEQ
jgi:hypothetical protein